MEIFNQVKYRLLVKSYTVLTGIGSFNDAPIIDGLKMATGRSAACCDSTCSARLFVKVYVLGLLPITCGVIAFTMSSFIHLFIHQKQISIVL